MPEEGAKYPAYRSRSKRFGRDQLERVVSVDDLSRQIARSSEKERWYIRAKVDLKTEEGVITKWLRTAEIKGALTEGRIIKCHEAMVSVVNVEDRQLLRKLRNRILRLYGCRCMRCGRTDGQLHLDHIQKLAGIPQTTIRPRERRIAVP